MPLSQEPAVAEGSEKMLVQPASEPGESDFVQKMLEQYPTVECEADAHEKNRARWRREESRRRGKRSGRRSGRGKGERSNEK